jgi:hypothetical protein
LALFVASNYDGLWGNAPRRCRFPGSLHAKAVSLFVCPTSIATRYLNPK